jgi:hypothetical protein
MGSELVMAMVWGEGLEMGMELVMETELEEEKALKKAQGWAAMIWSAMVLEEEKALVWALGWGHRWEEVWGFWSAVGWAEH